ncbi:hypothetical protein R3P38DRAFT_3190823 [Favolaschia claudopus]|uniref:Uncharacterized protein n=1 Tax=Favolaschia claudopus TaxID=2862362 RepID=A0AAW0BN22_9AGAR
MLDTINNGQTAKSALKYDGHRRYMRLPVQAHLVLLSDDKGKPVHCYSKGGEGNLEVIKVDSLGLKTTAGAKGAGDGSDTTMDGFDEDSDIPELA